MLHAGAPEKSSIGSSARTWRRGQNNGMERRTNGRERRRRGREGGGGVKVLGGINLSSPMFEGPFFGNCLISPH